MNTESCVGWFVSYSKTPASTVTWTFWYQTQPILNYSKPTKPIISISITWHVLLRGLETIYGDEKRCPYACLVNTTLIFLLFHYTCKHHLHNNTLPIRHSTKSMARFSRISLESVVAASLTSAGQKNLYLHCKLKSSFLPIIVLRCHWVASSFWCH